MMPAMKMGRTSAKKWLPGGTMILSRDPNRRTSTTKRTLYFQLTSCRHYIETLEKTKRCQQAFIATLYHCILHFLPWPDSLSNIGHSSGQPAQLQLRKATTENEEKLKLFEKLLYTTEVFFVEQKKAAKLARHFIFNCLFTIQQEV